MHERTHGCRGESSHMHACMHVYIWSLAACYMHACMCMELSCMLYACRRYVMLYTYIYIYYIYIYIYHHYYHRHHLDHHSTNYNACIQYMRHCFRKNKQTTSASYCGLGPAPAPFRPPHVPRSTCAQWWKIRTTSASYRGSKTTLPPLACTMQQAHVSLHKGICH